MNKKMSVIIIGCGARGKDVYAQYQLLHPDKMEIVAAADPDTEKLNEMSRIFKIPKDRCFTDSDELLSKERMADAAFICTLDRLHYDESIKALKKGYHLLLEKPISPSLSECREIEKTAKECNRHVVVCHVLRYTVFYQKIKELITEGKIGKPVSVQAIEQVGFWHQAHSFVRGNWRNSDETSPMILQKCCHDFDIFLWLINKSAKKVSSFGSLYEFKPENAPAGAAKRCIDCPYVNTCAYSAPKYYLGELENGNNEWPVNVVAQNPAKQSVLEALKTGQYGRCVYYCDNNVVDHQIVNIEMEDGITVNFTMCAFTKNTVRKITVMGTQGEIEADMEELIIKLKPFSGNDLIIDIKQLTDDFSGHSGGDMRMIDDLYSLITGTDKEIPSITSIDKSMESHYVALAAEQSRLNGGDVVDIKEFINSI